MELTKASEENGFTMPEVPIMEGAFGYFFSTGDGDGNENWIGLLGNMEAFKP